MLFLKRRDLTPPFLLFGIKVSGLDSRSQLMTRQKGNILELSCRGQEEAEVIRNSVDLANSAG